MKTPARLLTRGAIRRLLVYVTYKDWSFIIRSMGDGFYIQVAFMAHDNDDYSAAPTEQRGRKWYISKHMTDGEVVQTAFLAIRTAEEHEMRELFLFKGQRVFGPHFDIDKLAQFASSTNEVHRA